MTKKLEEIFNLPQVDDEDENVPEVPEEPPVPDIQRFSEVMNSVNKVDQALPIVKNLETNEKEMDELAEEAMDTFRQLMDLGMNVEAKYSGRLFEVASSLMGHAITAKDAKIANKLKILDMELKKARLENQMKDKDDKPQVEGQVLNRNQLLEYILKQQKDQE